MNASTLARSLPAMAVRRWRSLRLRTILVLGLLAITLPALSWFFLPDRPYAWPTRTVLELSRYNTPLAFSPDGRTFLCSGPKAIIPWDTSSGRQGTPWVTEKGWFIEKGVYSSDGRTFAAVVVDHPQLVSFELFDTSTGRTKATLTTQHPILYDFAFADDGRTFRAVLGDSGAIKEAATWDVATGQQTSSRPITAPTRLCNLAFSPDGRLLAMIPWRSTAVQLWDLEADRSLGGLTNPARAGLVGSGLAFSPDSRTLAVGHQDGAVDLCDVPARKVVQTLTPHPRGYVSRGIQFAPDGQTLASSAREDGSKTSALFQAYEFLRRKLLGSTRSPRSEIIVVDLATGRRIARTSSSHVPMYTPDGRTLAIRQENLSLGLRDLPDEPKSKEDRP